MHRYFIELAYNGSGYNGWQIQPNAPSVQETINHALSLLLKQEINVTGAGRTDTGVHASFFVAHFESDVVIPHTKALVDKLNRFLGKNIAIKDIYALTCTLAFRRYRARTNTTSIKTKIPLLTRFPTGRIPYPTSG